MRTFEWKQQPNLNFLAHIYLSFDDQPVAIGNFIADHIRGKQYRKFPEDVQKGILLHRAIDTYTDAHPITRTSTRRLHDNYHHYSPVIVDIYYDHFLARRWERYSQKPLEDYVEDFYTLLQEEFHQLPSGVQRMVPYMVSDNWLLSYASLEGIARVLEGMNRRTALKSNMHMAINDLVEHYDAFEAEFHEFFDELIRFSKHKLASLS